MTDRGLDAPRSAQLDHLERGDREETSEQAPHFHLTPRGLVACSYHQRRPRSNALLMGTLCAYSSVRSREKEHICG